MGPRNAKIRRLVAREPLLVGFGQELKASQVKEQKKARMTLGLVRQRLRLAKLPPWVKAEANQFFDEAHRLGATLRQGRTASMGAAGRVMTLLYTGPDTLHELTFWISPGGARPNLTLERRACDPARESKTVFAEQGGVIEGTRETRVKGEDGWKSTTEILRGPASSH